MRTHPIQAICLVLLAPVVLLAATPASVKKLLAPPSRVWATYAEKSIEVQWDSVPSADGYNLYTGPSADAPKSQRLRINSELITSGTRFTYIWHTENGEKVRKVKGYEHHLSITAVRQFGSRFVESSYSPEVNNCYFDGFRNIQSPGDIERILVPAQTGPFLPLERRSNSRLAFLDFMAGPGAVLFKLVTDSLDFRETGGCAPVSTVLVNVLQKAGLYAYRVEGTFIKEYHAFVVIEIDNVEYVLDFTANQFVPGVSPVMVPRDRTFLDHNGKLALSGKPIYQPAKIYTPEQTTLNDSPSAETYRSILTRTLAESGLE